MNCRDFLIPEDQQALEDEGIIVPMKSNVPPQMPNLYNRNQNTYFQQSQSAFAPPLPVYSTTLTNSPIAMMNYFNAPSNRQQQHQQHHQQQHQHHLLEHVENSFLQQHIPVDMVTFLCAHNYESHYVVPNTSSSSHHHQILLITKLMKYIVRVSGFIAN
jgi:hypothetical protein